MLAHAESFSGSLITYNINKDNAWFEKNKAQIEDRKIGHNLLKFDIF